MHNLLLVLFFPQQPMSSCAPSFWPQILSRTSAFIMYLSLFSPLCPTSSSTGFGGCVDLIVDGVSLLNKIGLVPTDQPHHHDYIENEVQLAQSFAYFFAPGAAAE